MTERNQPPQEKQVRFGLVGIKFSEEDDGLGLSVLTQHGSVVAFPNSVYLCRRYRQFEHAARELKKHGVAFQVNYNIPKRLTRQQALDLANSDGWEEPDLMETNQINDYIPEGGQYNE